MKAINQITHEVILGASGPCKAYSGIAGAVRMFGDNEIILIASTRTALVSAAALVAPGLVLDLDQCFPVTVIHDRFVNREDNEL